MDETMDGTAAAEPRKVEELLKLGTYQGMSDEEVEAVIAYKVEAALQSDLHAEMVADLKRQQVIANQILAESNAAALSMVAQAMNCKPTLEVVADES